MRSKLPLLPSGPRGIRKSAFHGPWQNRLRNLNCRLHSQQELSGYIALAFLKHLGYLDFEPTSGCSQRPVLFIAATTFMEVKVQCSCGTRYKFDVEPINGQLPGPVGCPTCGADGTAAANAIIQQALSAQGAQQSAGNVQPPAAEKPRIRLHLPASPDAALAPASPLDSGAAPDLPPTPLTAGRHVAIAPVRQKPSHGRPGVALGIVGAVVGGFVGML